MVRLGGHFFHIGRGDHIYIGATGSVSQQLQERAMKEAGTQKRTFEEVVPREYHDFKDVFSKESFDELPPRRPWDHAIEFLPGKEPKFKSKLYPMNLDEQKQLDEFLDENLKTGRIQPSKSPIGAPVFFIKKKDGSLRLVQDYRALNEITLKNHYPLPLIQELFDKLKNTKYFTTLDI